MQNYGAPQKRRIKEVIVVEGRYDKISVAQAVDATIIETSGFGVFSDKEKVALLRKLAGKRGLIILTDSDRAGFLIRGRLNGMLSDANMKHAYIPDIKGREKRKPFPSNEGLIGVEGIPKDVIIMALARAGATFDGACGQRFNDRRITKADLYSSGLSGGADSAKKRRKLQISLDLPAKLSANSLIDVLNILYTYDEFMRLIEEKRL